MNSQEIREEISKNIAAAMGTLCPPWRQPWQAGRNSGLPRNVVSGKRYSGVNPLLLMGSATSHNFRSMYWGTKRQWEDMGAVVRSSPEFDPHWGSTILFSKAVQREREGPISGITDKFFFLKYYTVYNVDQVEAPSVDMLLASHPARQRSLAKKTIGRSMRLTRRSAEVVYGRICQRLDSLRPNAELPGDYEPARSLLAATGASIHHQGERAVYWHSPMDYIQMPPFECFDNSSDYYETAFHETCHWAEADHRLGQARGYKGNYPFSELVAELGACFLSAETGVPMAKQMLPRSQSYIQSWLSHMGNDTRYVFEAARQASKVADYLLQFQSNTVLV